MQPICIPEALSRSRLVGDVRAAEFQVSLVPGRALLPSHFQAWRELQSGDPELSNPCFSPEFTQAVAAVRPDVEVAFIQQGRGVAAIFPFQRRKGSRAIPIGGIVSDYQGLICRSQFNCDPRDILKACGLVAWDFDRLPASQHCFVPYHKFCEPSAVIHLPDGFESYAAARRAAGTHQIDDCLYMLRRLEREIGPVRFIAHSEDRELLRLVLDWKSQQYQRSRWPDLFATEWGRGLVEEIHGTQTPTFAGMLSLLFAGDKVLAGHIGMRSRSIWHYWFPAYDRQFAKYSPGLVLLLKMAQNAETLGLQTIDLGTGSALYKLRLSNASISVAEGSVERPSLLLLARSARRRLSSLLKKNTLR